jgi:hypothetical protein
MMAISATSAQIRSKNAVVRVFHQYITNTKKWSAMLSRTIVWAAMQTQTNTRSPVEIFILREN